MRRTYMIYGLDLNRGVLFRFRIQYVLKTTRVGAPGALPRNTSKTGVLSELTRRSETDKVRYVYYGLYVQQTCWTERMRNIMVVRAVLRSRETTYHPKIGQIHTYLGSLSVGIDTKCGTGRCCAGGGYCYAPFGPSGAIWASGLRSHIC